MTDILDLSKKFEQTIILNLQKAGVFQIPTMATRLAVDESGSMDDEFRTGLVDRTIALFTAAALKFDDDGLLEMGFFNHRFTLTEDATAADKGNYLKRVPRSAGGGTNYAPIIEAFETKKVAGAAKPAAAAPEKKGFFGRLFGGATSTPVEEAVRSGECEHRAYVGIITDGDAGDESVFERRLAATSGDTFYQFIAIGTQVTTRYLAGLAEKYPHVSFIHLPNPKSVTDEQFYEQIANDKLVSWIKGA